MTRPFCLLFASFASFAAFACARVPSHTGYPATEKAPWAKPKRIILNERNEGMVEGKLDYAKRDRAVWYLVNLDGAGELKVTTELDKNPATSDVEIEILDAGFNVLAGGQGEDAEDAGEDKKVRTVKVGPGKTYVHAYTLGKTDVVGYEIKVAFKTEGGSGGAATIPNPPPLAAVPAIDDAPRRKVTAPRQPSPPKATAPATGGVRGRIVEYSEEGGGVRIVIDKGQDQGVEQGWRGYIVSKTTKQKLSGSDFSVKTVRSSEAEAVVHKSVTEVQSNRSVVLSKP